MTGFGTRGLVTHCDGGTRSEREREQASERGASPVVSTAAEKGAEEGGGFFPIKQPAEFVFSPKRRCRFKVIDCHREGGTDGKGGESNSAGGGYGWIGRRGWCARGWLERGQAGTKSGGTRGTGAAGRFGI